MVSVDELGNFGISTGFPLISVTPFPIVGYLPKLIKFVVRGLKPKVAVGALICVPPLTNPVTVLFKDGIELP